ncbi:MAG: hypothetical protein ACR2RV_15840 [Verrucomicrobiales bacterium]
MTRGEAAALEAEFGVAFPPAYLDAITVGYPLSVPTEGLDTDAVRLSRANQECRDEDPWGFPWEANYWRVGGDGAGGFYFIDTQEDRATVYFCDHEDIPSSIGDLQRISVTPFDEFIGDLEQLEKDMEKWDEEMREAVANRKWWQFWIPRQWPPEPKAGK